MLLLYAYCMGIALVKVEMGALIIVASRSTPSLSITPFSRRLLVHGLQDLLRNPVFFQQVAVGEAFSAGVVEDRCLPSGIRSSIMP
jgi:hypothetical protein